jgi:hypothetical protein
MKFIVQFNAHVSESYRQGLLAEIEDRHGALYAMRPNGIAEITDFRAAEADLIKSFLTDEDERGTIGYWLEP